MIKIDKYLEFNMKGERATLMAELGLIMTEFIREKVCDKEDILNTLELACLSEKKSHTELKEMVKDMSAEELHKMLTDILS